MGIEWSSIISLFSKICSSSGSEGSEINNKQVCKSNCSSNCCVSNNTKLCSECENPYHTKELKHLCHKCYYSSSGHILRYSDQTDP